MSIAYAPRGGYTADNFGTIAVGDGSLDLHAALKDSDGVLLVDDENTLLQAVLNEMPALEQVDPLDALSASELRKAAHERGLKASGSADDLRAAIAAHDAAPAPASDTSSAAAIHDDDED